MRAVKPLLRWTGLALLLASPVSAQDNTQPPTIPPIEVEAPPGQNQPPTIPPIDVDAPGVPPVNFPEELDAGAGAFGGPTSPSANPNGGTDFSGSPFNNFSTPSNSLNGLTPGFGPAVTPFNSPRSVTTLDQARIREQSAGATPELLESVPGVLLQRTNQGGGSLIIRGRNGNQNLIMVDGIPINDAGWRYGNVQYLNTIDPGVIDRIEVIRGPASVAFGSGAVGGVVNIITKRAPVTHHLDVHAGLISTYSSAYESSYNSGFVTASFLNLGMFASASYLDTGAVRAGQGLTFDDAIVAYEQTAANIRFDQQLNDKWSATLVYQYLNQEGVPRTDRFPTPLIDPTRFINRPTVVDPQRRDFGYLRLARVDEDAFFLHGLQLTLNAQRRRELLSELRLADRNDAGVLVPRAPDRQQFRFNQEDIFNWGVDLRGFTQLSPYHTLVYGTTFYHDELDTLRTQSRGVGAPLLPVTPSLPSDGRYNQFGVFVQDRLELTDRLTLNAGVRYSNINATGTIDELGDNRSVLDVSFQNWSGEGGLVYKLTDWMNLVALVSEGFRAPNFDDLASSDRSTGRGQDFGTANLSVERVVNYEVGAKVQTERLQGQATYYYSDAPNQIVRARQNGNNVRINTEGFVTGAEVEGALLVTESLSLFTGASHTFGHDETLDEPLARINPTYLLAGARWTYRAPTWNLYLEGYGEMMDEQTRLSTTDKNDIRIPIGGTPAWQTLNVRMGINTDCWGSLTMGLYNIFDQNYRLHGSGVDAPGRDFRAGYEVTY